MSELDNVRKKINNMLYVNEFRGFCTHNKTMHKLPICALFSCYLTLTKLQTLSLVTATH